MKNKVKKILNGLLGIVIILAFLIVDVIVSSVPFWLIDPKSVFGYGASILSGIVIFIFLILMAVLMIANKFEKDINGGSKEWKY